MSPQGHWSRATIFGEYGLDDYPTDERVDSRELGGGAVTVGRGDVELK